MRRLLTAGLTNYGDDDFSLFLRKAFIKGAGYTDEALDRKIVGVVDTSVSSRSIAHACVVDWQSGFNPCHANVPQLVEATSRGVMLEGCLPVPFPTISIHEAFAHPTSMFLRNLMSMDAEEMIRAQPMDTVVLIGGCDKTVPALLMGAISADVPAIQLVTGPMVTGSHRGTRVGACTDCRRYWGMYRANEIDSDEITNVGNELVPSAGVGARRTIAAYHQTCGVMGTASTMACLTEALGIAPLGSATAPANVGQRLRIAELTGKLAAGPLPRPREILTRESFENAITLLQALGGSTNAVVHLLAIAGRVDGVNLTLDGALWSRPPLTLDFDRIGRHTPLLVDLKPSGMNYMEDLYKVLSTWLPPHRTSTDVQAGGVPVILRQLASVLHLDALTVTGRTLGAELERFPSSFKQSIVRPFQDPLAESSSLVVLRGNLAPEGCILKQSAMASHLKRHEGVACVFKDLEDMIARIDDPDLPVDASSV